MIQVYMNLNLIWGGKVIIYVDYGRLHVQCTRISHSRVIFQLREKRKILLVLFK